MTPRVLVVGDVIDDVLVRPEGPVRDDTDTPSRIERVPGGSAANTACWLAVTGAAATLVATVGAGDAARCGADLARHGVVPRLGESAALPTGTIVVLSQGERRTMLTDRGANRATAPEAVTDALLSAHDHLHLTAHGFADEDRDERLSGLRDRAAAGGARRSVAPGSAGLLAEYGPARFRRVVAGVEVLVASEAEAALLTGEPDAARAARALAEDHALVAVTLGGKGALVRTDGQARFVPAVPAVLADPTGAGDAWVAGLLAGLADGASPWEAAGAAARLAARAVEQVGARPR
ncbi:carbohydrate kinase family protein [Amnibacterium endophyticum]|uniref:Carbohydrate kinase family protein n=1 Tax=Amnibacterium endophyticum TaxID=2109337 RepID=A0ABW4LGP8_9MICO